MTTLLDRLPLDLGAHFAAQLPLLICGVYYEGFVPGELPRKYRRIDAWQQAIARAGHNIPASHTAGASHAVFRVFDRELDAALMRKIGESLPVDIHDVVVH